MPRAGLDPDIVTAAAARIVDRDGPSALTLAAVAADLGVRAPSLYNHVEGLDGLIRRVGLAGIDELGEVCRSAVMGASQSDALHALAAAYREYAGRHPGVYQLTQVAHPEDPEFSRRAERVLEPVLAVLASFGLEGDDLIHAARGLRSLMHGFSLLDTKGGFGLDTDIDDSFRWMVETFARGLRSTLGTTTRPSSR